MKTADSFTVLIVLGLLCLVPCFASSPQLSVRMPSQSIVLGAPIVLEVKITADVPEGQVWVSSTNFSTIKIDGPSGLCRRNLGPSVQPRSPYSPWYKHDVELVGQEAKWSEQIGLQGDFFLEEPGTYTATLSWRSQPLDEYGAMDAKRTLEAKSPGKTFHYLTTLQASKEVKFQLTDPVGLDKEAFDYFKGAPLGYRQELLTKFPASTYSGYALLGVGGTPWNLLPIEEIKM